MDGMASTYGIHQKGHYSGDVTRNVNLARATIDVTILHATSSSVSSATSRSTYMNTVAMFVVLMEMMVAEMAEDTEYATVSISTCSMTR